MFSCRDAALCFKDKSVFTDFFLPLWQILFFSFNLAKGLCPRVSCLCFGRFLTSHGTTVSLKQAETPTATAALFFCTEKRAEKYLPDDAATSAKRDAFSAGECSHVPP